ncbi:MAG: triose-phosphate isomerase [Bacteroidia bacterium]
MARKRIVAGNWKMNKSLEESQALITEIRGMVRDEHRGQSKVVLFPTFLAIPSATRLLEGTGIGLGAQNCHWEESGAYTGELSASMLQRVGAQYVLVGHSERRQYFGETNETCAQKIKSVIRQGMTAVYCVGETLSQREDKSFFAVIEKQISEGLFGLDRKEIGQVVIAYEPVWAIGTGLNASPSQAEEIHAHIRRLVAHQYSQEIADDTSILYGGSVKPDNAQELFMCPNIDGGLIGGASLKARDFIDIAKALR